MFDELLIQERKKQYKCALRGGECNRREQEEHKSSKVPGGTPYISDIGICRPQGYGFNSAPFRSIDVAHFGLESGVVFEETT